MRFAYLALCVVASIGIGYLLLGAILHFAELIMTSDADLNTAVVVGLLAWVVVVILAVWLGARLFIRRHFALGLIDKAVMLLLCFVLGIVSADLLFALWATFNNFSNTLSREHELLILATGALILGLVWVFAALRLNDKLLLKTPE